jgi:alpha-tubulin suppressor-like RCC1 family protein
VQCWGDNTYGQLGNGNSTGPEQCTAFESPCSTTPAPVVGLSRVVGIAAGGISVCALSKHGAVQCWGNNLDGQLGDGSTNGPNTCDTFPCSTTPVALAGSTHVKALGAGTCALSRRRAVECWGTNGNGELGIGTDTGPQTCVGGPCSTTPVAVPSLDHHVHHVVQLSGTCALLSDGTVQCWGSNISGELGDGTATGPELCSGYPCSTTPTPVAL